MADGAPARTWEVASVIAAVGLVALVLLWPGGPGFERLDGEVETALARARTLIGEGEEELALVELGRALAHDPDNRDVRLQVAGILKRRGRSAAARREYQLALESGEEASTHIALGLLALQTDDLDAAIEHFGGAIALEPLNAIAHLDLGIALLRAGRSDQALPVCRRAAELAPDNLDAVHNFGYALRLTGQNRRAITVLEGVIERDARRAISWFELGETHAAAGQIGPARAAWQRVLDLDPGHGAARRRLETPAGETP